MDDTEKAIIRQLEVIQDAIIAIGQHQHDLIRQLKEYCDGRNK